MLLCEVFDCVDPVSILKTEIGEHTLRNAIDSLRLPTVPGENFFRKYLRTKVKEANLCVQMPKNHSFVDVGAHNGDTVLSIAALCKIIGRDDIRFYAFEPNTTKVEFIRKAAQMNGLKIVVVQKAVGELEQRIAPTGDTPALSGATAYKPSQNGMFEMTTLDNYRDVLSPVGHLHLDVEGWEASVIKGARNLLHENRCTLLAEVWGPEDAKKRGFSTTAEEDIDTQMRKHPHFQRAGFIRDGNTNVLYVPL